MTKTKRGIKLLGIFAISLFAICIFSTNKVNANCFGLVTSGEITANSLDSFPSTINVNLKESEFEKAEKEIFNQIIDELNIEAKDITDEIIEFSNNQPTSYTLLTILQIDINKYYISISNEKENILKKNISVVYNNSSDYNEADKEYVENLVKELSKDGYDDMIFYSELGSIFYSANDGLDILNKAINDTSIKVKHVYGGSGGGGDLIFTYIGSSDYGIFKNDVYYAPFGIRKTYRTQITVPSNIEENETVYINYAKAKMNKYIEGHEEEWGISKVKSIQKENENLYKYTLEDNRTTGYIIIKKEEKKPVELTDKSTNIKLETTTAVVPEGTTLTAEKVTKGDSYNTVVKAVENDIEKFVLYDISLVNNNANIQPNGKVKVSIPVPEGFDISKILVYYIAKDGTKTKIDATIKNGYITFETDHFSNYIIAEEKSQDAVSTNEETTQQTETNTTNTQADTTNTKTETTKRELDQTPKTGAETNGIAIISSVLSLVSMLGMAIVRKF